MTGFLSKTPIVKKLWGWEFWVVNTDLYCFKILHLNPGFCCSLHYHRTKDETFVVQSGRVELEIGVIERKTIILNEGDQFRIPSGFPHRFRALDGRDAVVYEVSTEHSDSDVVRLEESAAVPANA